MDINYGIKRRSLKMWVKSKTIPHSTGKRIVKKGEGGISTTRNVMGNWVGAKSLDTRGLGLPPGKLLQPTCSLPSMIHRTAPESQRGKDSAICTKVVSYMSMIPARRRPQGGSESLSILGLRLTGIPQHPSSPGHPRETALAVGT